MENSEGENDQTFNILAWWKYNTNKYSILSRLARDVLVVPVSTVASESAFSTGGRILDPFLVHLPLRWYNLSYVLKIGFNLQCKFRFDKPWMMLSYLKIMENVMFLKFINLCFN